MDKFRLNYYEGRPASFDPKVTIYEARSHVIETVSLAEAGRQATAFLAKQKPAGQKPISLTHMPLAKMCRLNYYEGRPASFDPKVTIYEARSPCHRDSESR